jgi:putative peptidoglycan lipid II flippase
LVPAFFVAAGILLSRLAGLVRVRVFAHYFGLASDAADAFNAAFRIPNVLQNLFGEGALSASFIPVYAALVSRDDRREADRVAAAVGAILGLVVSVLVLVGVVATPWLIALIAPGFSGDKRELTIVLVRILFPGAGLLVLSAWCLGVLNSHGRFLLSYTAPVMWNVAMIATLLIFGAGTSLARLAVLLAWGSVAGSTLQLIVQVPAVIRVAPGVLTTLAFVTSHVRTVLANFVPVFVSRGVLQLSAYIDAVLASLLPTGAVTGLANAQGIYLLPISLFGMSVAAAELPAMSGDADRGNGALRSRVNRGLRQVAFFIVPSATAFLTLGDVIVAALFQTGRFRYEDAVYVWAVLAGSSVGLLPSTLGRLYSSTFYALKDTKTPLRFALVHVAVATALGYVLAIPGTRWLGIPPVWGAVGLTAAAGVGGWVEMLLLRTSLERRIGEARLPARYIVTLWVGALAGAAVAWAVRLTAPALHPMLTAIVVLGPYGVAYFAVMTMFRIPEADAVLKQLVARFGSLR